MQGWLTTLFFKLNIIKYILNSGFKECAKKNVQKFFERLKNGHLYVPRNVQIWNPEKLFEKRKFVTEVNFYRLVAKNRSSIL